MTVTASVRSIASRSASIEAIAFFFGDDEHGFVTNGLDGRHCSEGLAGAHLAAQVCDAITLEQYDKTYRSLRLVFPKNDSRHDGAMGCVG